MKVNLGGGLQSYEHPGYISVDKIKSDGVDIVWDLEMGLPKKVKNWSGPGNPHGLYTAEWVFGADTVDEFLCIHVLEHIRGLMPLMEEMWTALKPDGVLHIRVPNAAHSEAAWSDPTHVRAFTPKTFWYFTKEGHDAYPYTDKLWRILDGYPKVNGTVGDWWEIEAILSPVK